MMFFNCDVGEDSRASPLDCKEIQSVHPKGTSLSRKQEKEKTYLQKLNLIKKMVNRASLRAQLVKNLPAVQETTVRFLVWEDLLKKG